MFGLEKHPFEVSALLKHSVVLAYAVPAGELARHVPEPLALDTFQDRFGFVAVAAVKTEGLRPRGLPSIFGRSFLLIGYRIFVRFTNAKGRTRRGLYILRSDTNKAVMRRLGSIFTRYNYRHVDIAWSDSPGGATTIRSAGSELAVSVAPITADMPLPKDSPFTSWQQARRFAGPMPYTFSVNRDNRKVLSVRGRREDWTPSPLSVDQAHSGLFEELEIDGAQLANAFEVRDVPYRWDRGVEEPWSAG